MYNNNVWNLRLNQLGTISSVNLFLFSRMKGSVREKKTDKEREIRESLSVTVKEAGTLNGGTGTLSENLAQQ